MADPSIGRSLFDIQHNVIKDSIDKHKGDYLDVYESLVPQYIAYLSNPLKSTLPRAYLLRGVGKEQEEKVDPDIANHIPRDIINYYGYQIMRKLTLPRSALKRLPRKITDEELEFMTEELIRYFGKIPKSKRRETLPLDDVEGMKLEIQDRNGFRLPFHSIDEMVESVMLQIQDVGYRKQWLRTLDRIQQDLVPSQFLLTTNVRNRETMFAEVVTTWVPFYSSGDGYDVLYDAITRAIEDVNRYVSQPTIDNLVMLYTNLANSLVTNPDTKSIKDDVSQLILSEVEIVEYHLRIALDYTPSVRGAVNREQFPLLPFHTVLGIVTLSIRLLLENTYGQEWLQRLEELRQQASTRSQTSSQFFTEFKNIKDANQLDRAANIWYIDRSTYPREFKKIVNYLLQGDPSLARILCRQILTVPFLKKSLRKEATHIFFYQHPITSEIQGVCAANIHKSDGTPARREARFADAKKDVWIMTILLFCTAETGGIGQLLMQQIKLYAKQEDLNYIYLAALADVIGFYRNMGFQNSRNLRGEETANTKAMWNKVQELGCRLWTQQNVLTVPAYVDFLKFLIQNDLAHSSNNCQSIEDCNQEGYDMQLVLTPWKERGHEKVDRGRHTKEEKKDAKPRSHKKKLPPPTVSRLELGRLLRQIPFCKSVVGGQQYGVIDFYPSSVRIVTSKTFFPNL